MRGQGTTRAGWSAPPLEPPSAPSHYIKNGKTKRAETVLTLVKQARRVIMLSGTPALSRPEELYTQLDALRPGTFGSWTAYAKRYCNAHHGRFGWDTKVERGGGWEIV